MAFYFAAQVINLLAVNQRELSISAVPTLGQVSQVGPNGKRVKDLYFLSVACRQSESSPGLRHRPRGVNMTRGLSTAR